MTHEQLLNKLYYEDLNFIGIHPLYTLAKKHDKTITKEFVSNWLKSQSTQQQTTKMVKKKEYKPIYNMIRLKMIKNILFNFQRTYYKPTYSDDYYAYQIDLTFLNKYKNSNDGIYVLFTAININSRYAHAYYGKNKNKNNCI